MCKDNDFFRNCQTNTKKSGDTCVPPPFFVLCVVRFCRTSRYLLNHDLELSARARSRSIKRERALALFSLNHDLLAVHDVQTLLSLVNTNTLQVVDLSVLQGVSLHSVDAGSRAC